MPHGGGGGSYTNYQPEPWSQNGGQNPYMPMGQGGGNFGGGGYQPPNFTSTTQRDPEMQWWTGKAKEFLDTSTLDKQKSNAANDISSGVTSQLGAMNSILSRQGIGGSGVGVRRKMNIVSQGDRDKQRAFTNLDIADKQRRDQMLLGAQGGFAEPGRLQAQIAQNQAQNWMNMNQLYGQQQNNAFNQMMSMMQMFAPPGGYGGQAQGGYGMSQPVRGGSPFGGGSYGRRPGLGGGIV